MPRGGYRPNAGRKRKSDSPPAQKVKIVKSAKVVELVEPPQPMTASIKPESDADQAPSVKFLEAVMGNDEVDLRMRVDAAKALLAYQAKKPAETGVKKQREEAAKEKAKKFQAITPPRLVNG